MSQITEIYARQVLDSRGHPTVEVEVHCQGGVKGCAIVPSGASTGKHEAVELRDGDPNLYQGKSVYRAVANVTDAIAPRLKGMDAAQQADIDRIMCELDGTPNKSRLGANAILGVSLACAHAAAAGLQQPLWRYLAEHWPSLRKPSMPIPMVNMISGGLHAGGQLDFQDFLLMPVAMDSYSKTLAMIVAVYRSLGRLLAELGYEGILVGDEGGFGPRLPGNEDAVQMLLDAIQAAGFQPGRDAAVGLDVASTHFHQDGKYHIKGTEPLTAAGMTDLLEQWVQKYPIASIEDGLAEDDWPGWQALTAALAERTQILGDDLFVTNPDRLRRGIADKVGNAVLVKLNQIGTLAETLEVIRLAQEAGYRPVVSARSGETEDATIADLAVATGAGQIKIGSVARSERLAKYNRLLRIEEEMKA